jgi:segregation and condensation protein A
LNDGRTAASDEVLSKTHPRSSADAFRIALPSFEGPLDLLLHLIKEHQLDIFNIPIAIITEKYIEHLERMREVNLEIAGEFLVMASTLAHIKSRLLLPTPAPQSEGEAEEPPDPRAELVRRLLEYQKYKEAGEALLQQDLLSRDVFARRVRVSPVPLPEDDLGLVEIDVYRLIQSLDAVLKRLGPEVGHEVVRDRLSISDAIHSLLARFQQERALRFTALLEGFGRRSEVVVAFLAILEMCKLRLIRIAPDAETGEFVVTAIPAALPPPETSEVDESDYR